MNPESKIKFIKHADNMLKAQSAKRKTIAASSAVTVGPRKQQRDALAPKVNRKKNRQLRRKRMGVGLQGKAKIYWTPYAMRNRKRFVVDENDSFLVGLFMRYMPSMADRFLGHKRSKIQSDINGNLLASAKRTLGRGPAHYPAAAFQHLKTKES